MTWLLLLVAFVAFCSAADAGDIDYTPRVQSAATLYLSFDEAVRADRGKGALDFSTRFNHPTEKGKFVFEKGFDSKAFRSAKDKGKLKGCLDAVDVLPNNGRIFIPLKDNLAFKKGGWSGSLSVWINTDPDKLLKTTFCDPIQITEKGANNGGIWFDFNNDKPRTMRMGFFSAVKEGEKPVAESDPDAPMVPIKSPGFKEGVWHHIAITWSNLDTGKKDALAILYIDGKERGRLQDREISMDWNVDKAGIYVAVNYIGLLDELALFGRALEPVEVDLLRSRPGILQEKK